MGNLLSRLTSYTPGQVPFVESHSKASKSRTKRFCDSLRPTPHRRNGPMPNHDVQNDAKADLSSFELLYGWIEMEYSGIAMSLIGTGYKMGIGLGYAHFGHHPYTTTFNTNSPTLRTRAQDGEWECTFRLSFCISPDMRDFQPDPNTIVQ